MRTTPTIALAVLLFAAAFAGAVSELLDLKNVPKDLETPPMTEAGPAPGRRVKAVTSGYESNAVHHALYLPTNWRPDRKFPVIFEYAGNGNYSNKFGDISLGTVDGSNLGYGISGGSNFIWVCLPFVKITNGQLANANVWWGDVEATVAYCKLTVREVCAKFGGDTNALFLAGFSRGAIACNFLGLHDDEIAKLWRGFIAHSHYDGVRTNWPYAGADRASALTRLQRLNGRPQFISHEGSTEATKNYLTQTVVKGAFTFVDMPYRNHRDDWVLRDIPERQRVREWLADALRESPNR